MRRVEVGEVGELTLNAAFGEAVEDIDALGDND